MKSTTLNDIIARIDELNQIHLSLRGIVQYVAEHHEGKNKINWRSKIPSNWFELEFTFQNPINKQTRKELNILSEYLNQNFIIRLHSLLEYEGIKTNNVQIDTELEGHKMIEIIHFLRKQYAHRLGEFDQKDNESMKLRTRLFNEFQIDQKESLPTQFPLDKNRVIKPIVDGTKKYVKAFWEKNRK